MKIKTQFINSMVIFGIILLIIATSVIVTNQQVERLNKQEEIAKSIERSASELGYLSNDYLLYHESPQRARWESKFSELSDDISNLNPNSPEQQTLVNNIRSNQQRLKAVFTDVVSTFENTSQGAVADPALFQISWSRMAVQNQGMAFDSARLSQILHDQADQLEQTNIRLISALLVILGLYFLTNYLIVYRRALRSISELQAGTRIIGSGNFDFAIKQKNDDEIGELSHAFNQMTVNLKEVTASKTELEREITERKRAEEALRESEQRLRRFYESGLVGVMYWNMDGAITDANDKFLEMVGYTREELAAGHIDWANMTPPEYRHLDEHSIAELKATGVNKMPFEKEYICKDGTCIPIIVAGAMLDEARFNGVAFVLDITERKRAEEALKESEQLWATTLASIGDAVISTDVEGRITFMNAVAEALTGWTLAEASTKPVTEVFNIINEDTHVEVEDPVTKVLQKGMIVGLANHTILVRKDGTEIPIDDSGAPIKDRDGKTMGVVLVFRDITERKRAEEALRKSEERYRRLFETMQENFSLMEVITDEQGRPVDYSFLEANTALERYSGKSREQLVGRKHSDIMAAGGGTAAQKWFDIICRVGLTGKEESGEHYAVSTGRWAQFHAFSPLHGQCAVISMDITDHKRAEEALRESEQKFMKLFQGNAAAIALTRLRDRHIIEVNERWQEVFGFSREDVVDGIANKIKLWKHPEEQMRAIHDLEMHGAFRNRECEFFRKNGEVWTGLMSSEVIQLQWEEFILTSLVDITERKRAEEALARSSRRVSEVLESITDGFMAIDNDWCFTYVNQRAAGNLGFKPEDLIGQNIWEKFPAIKDTDHEIYYRRAIQQREPQYFEMYGVLTDKWYEIRVYPSAEGISVFWQDTTERKQAEEALRKAHDELELRVQERTAELKEANKALIESEASYRELTESINDLFYAMDKDLRYTYWNKASEAFIGILAKDAIGKSLLEIFPDVKRTKVEQFYIEALKTQQPQRFESEYQLGEKKFTFEVNAYPTKIGLSVIAKDITEKKMLEAQLLRAQRMESIGTLAGGIAHDLNNMLTPIMMSLQMFKEKYKDEQSQKLLTILEQNSQRSADLIKQVLSFARGVEGERNPLAAKHIITEIEKISKETFPRNIEIRTDIPKDLYTILGDATQLHQVIMNLCVNARDAMPDGGILNITASNFFIDENYSRMHTEAKIGSYIIIGVSDTGTGIPPKILDRIFEPFFTTKEFGKGTGLGLSTVLAIVKSHGGFINVNSEVGEGTTFGVYLPAIKTEIQSIDEKPPELLIGRGELILVAEDEDSVREVTISTLEKNGYRVLTASDGVEAISSYAQNMEEIKVILMDMMMPFMDGHASIRAIRRINPEVKIIAVSGLAEKDKLKNIAEHTNAFLPKPYTAEKLLKIIHEVLNAK